MEKQLIESGVPGIGGPLNMAVRFGPMFFVSGLPPFGEEFAAKLREARANGTPHPPFRRYASKSRRRW